MTVTVAGTVRHDTIVLEHIVKTSPRQLFAAWADPEINRRWDVSGEDWLVTHDTHDFREGGGRIARFGPPGDLRYREVMHYLHIIADARIVFAYTVSCRDVCETASLATAEIAPHAAGAALRITEQIAVLDDRKTAVTDRARGWMQALDKLDAVFAA